MTTIGTAPEQVNRVFALRFPSHSYQYPAFKNKQRRHFITERVCALQPRFRKTTEERKRQERECRKLDVAAIPMTTPLERGIVCYHDLPPKTPVPCKPDLITRARIRPRDFQRWCYDSTPVVGTRAREQWAEFLNRCPERFQIDLPLEGCGQTNTPYFDGGYAVRYLRPYLTSGQGMERWPERPFPSKRNVVATDSPYRPAVVCYALNGQ